MTAKEFLLTLNPSRQQGVINQYDGLQNDLLLENQNMIDFLNTLEDFKGSTVEVISVEFDTPVIEHNDDGTISVTNTSDPEVVNVIEDEKLRFSDHIKLHSIWLSNNVGKDGEKVIYRVTPDSVIPFEDWRDDRLNQIL